VSYATRSRRFARRFRPCSTRRGWSATRG
jgi:hypothetical protein